MAGHPITMALVLGAGASRGVSYADKCDIQSPLDTDFFDLLQRVEGGSNDRPAIEAALDHVRQLPHGHWRSMERAFYTLHLRAYLHMKLTGDKGRADETVIKDFARCVQALLRKAHGTRTCKHHRRLLEPMLPADTVLSFNYDLVPERALKPIAERRRIAFGDWLYGLCAKTRGNLPTILKLHGSSNWKMAGSGRIEVLTTNWNELDDAPGYRGYKGDGTAFPIFLPFWDKRIEEPPWLAIWTDAFKRLSRVDALLVWGYSLPLTDIKARHLVSLSLGQREIRLCVVDPSPKTRDRWRELLPDAQFFPYSSIGRFFDSPPPWWKKRGTADVRK